jgi:hypothetical protein
MLIDALRARLGSQEVHSFQLMGEDLVALTNEDLETAAEHWQQALARIPASVRPRFLAAQNDVQRDAHAFLRKYNKSVHTRVAGYVELGKRVEFAYPWPVVAILGIEQVRAGIRQNRVYGLVGAALERVWHPLVRMTELTEDVLRRTNRGIFADSTPTLLYALAALAARRAGDRELADALLDGPLPPFMDEECGALSRALVDGLDLADPDERFATLAALTHRHFAREQAIFTHHLGGDRRGGAPRSRVIARLTAVREVPAPAIETGRVVQRPFRLPDKFDMRDHAARVDAFGKAFVTSVTGSRADYDVAAKYVLARYAV